MLLWDLLPSLFQFRTSKKLSFIDTGYGYRLNQNLVNSKLTDRKDNILESPALSQAVLKARLKTPYLNNSKEQLKTENTPRYSTFTYQFHASKKTVSPKNDIASQFDISKAEHYRRPANANSQSVPITVPSETFLKFLILKAKHYKWR